MSFEIYLKREVLNDINLKYQNVNNPIIVDSINLNVSGFIGINSFFIPISDILFIKNLN